MNNMKQCRKSVLHNVFPFLCLISLKVNAQLNKKDTVDWQIKLSASGSLLDGNVARLLLVNRLEIAHAQPAWGLSTRSDYQYGTTRRVTTENDFVSYNFFYLHPLHKIYPYLMAIVETNYRRKIEFRYQVGPGSSYTAWSKRNNLLRLSITGTYEHSRFGETKFKYIADTLSNTITVWRITGRIFCRQKLFEDKLNLLYEFWWQQSITDYHNYRLYNEAVFEVPLCKEFSFRTGFRYTYENVRLEKLKPFDLFWTFGLTVSSF